MMMPTKSVAFIKALFADERFDMVQIGDLSIDRRTLVDVRSVPVAEDEWIIIETTEYKAHIYASQITCVGQVREMGRATFEAFMQDDRIESITIHFSRDSGLANIVVKKDELIFWQPNPANHLATLIETEREILEVRWADVASVSATKKPRGDGH